MKHPKHYDTDERTSKRMANVKLKRGDAEVLLARKLWNKGYRYRLNYKKLPGSPDIAILKYNIAVFIDGEFWHGKDWAIKKDKLKRNRDYWIEKIEENMARDDKVNKQLIARGWTAIHFWSKDVIKNTEECILSIEELIFESKMNSDYLDD